MDSVSVQLDKALTEVSEETNELLFVSMSKAMKKAKQDVTALSPSNPYGKGNHYRQGWTIRTKRLKYGFEGVIYNRLKPGLTHLLNNGHVVKNQYGTYGTKAGDGHITKAHDKAEEYLMTLLMEAQL